MRVCGIVCEYDPFHRGHALHIQKTRELLGDDAVIVCCMSGNFTQRGEAALMPKHLRCASALKNGADLIFELPTAYALLSAEGFAAAGIGILAATGVMTDLSFGAETDDIASLREIAALLLEHETAQKTLLELKTGISYAAARERALYNAVKEKSAVISHPNNILAVEYLKALLRQNLSINPITVKRAGAMHDAEDASDGIASASAIRTYIRSKDWNKAREYLPEDSFASLLSAGESGCLLDDTRMLDRMIHSYLLRLREEDFRRIPGVSEGLEHRLVRALRETDSADAAAFAARTKRYPLSRIRRIFTRAYLGLTAEYSTDPPPYCRVLGFNDRGRMLLSQIGENALLPVITKPAHINKLPENARRLFEREALCTDLYFSSLSPKNKVLPGSEWRMQPIYIKHP